MFRDGQAADIVITLTREYQDRMADALKLLEGKGMTNLSADDNSSVVEGTIDYAQLTAIEELDCVAYVRRVMVYNVDYPAGHPRDYNEKLKDLSDHLPPQQNQRKMGKNYP
jgi:hypothetical protein